MNKVIVALGLSLAVAGPAMAQDIKQENFYAGAGIGLNSLSGFDDATGFQIFGGYHLDMIDLDPVKLAVEIGHFDSGTFERTNTVTTPGGTTTFTAEGEATGLWSNAVFAYPLNPKFDLLGRIGLDFGDDDGLMYGAGIDYELSQQFQLRGEYVIRDDIDSLQANLVYQF